VFSSANFSSYTTPRSSVLCLLSFASSSLRSWQVLWSPNTKKARTSPATLAPTTEVLAPIPTATLLLRQTLMTPATSRKIPTYITRFGALRTLRRAFHSIQTVLVNCVRLISSFKHVLTDLCIAQIITDIQVRKWLSSSYLR
jgi:hypothetical protein